jgi:2-phosphosulfolactate phosphatase
MPSMTAPDDAATPRATPLILSVAHSLGEIDLNPTRRAHTAAIVVDVIRATTTLAVMFEHGARRVLVARDVEQARRARVSLPLAILAGEVNAVAPPDFDHGNSPEEWSTARLADREILFSTTNGARALHAAMGGGPVFAGSLRNASAVCSAALTAARQLATVTEPGRVSVICSGLGEQPADDDSLCAGWLIYVLQRMAGQMGIAAEPGAGAPYALDLLAARRRAYAGSDDGDALDANPRAWLEAALAETPAARGIQQVGLGEDLAWCVDVDASTAVPMVAGEDVARQLVIVELAPPDVSDTPIGGETS